MSNGEKSGLRSSMTPEELKAEVDPSPQVRALKAREAALKKRVNQLKIALGEVNDFFQQVLGTVDQISPPKIIYRTPGKVTVAHACSVINHWTDWHIGKVVSPSEIEDFNEFNLKIARKRITGKLLPKILEWVETHRSAYTLDECVILFTGDPISGDIHDELKVTNEFPAPVQCVEAGYLFADAVAMISPHFKTVRVEFITLDNHSRLTKKAQFSQGGYNSLSYVVAKIASERLAQFSNVIFNIYPQIMKVIEVRGTRYLCTHGHQIRGWAGFPYYGIDRETSREAKARINMPEEKRFHKVCLGHWHSPLNHQHWVIGGSLSGTDEYDHGNGRHAEPIQTAWINHPKYPEIDWNKFIL